ncbi:MAG: 1-acyl-sn-glycerol-3-phosphate acyltransferase [Desulfobacterales bacterium]|nr:MAG: 1-acyl-sn-glycerol-3-phosphate acyltransferase [Desulfobacterales bacterium]
MTAEKNTPNRPTGGCLLTTVMNLTVIPLILMWTVLGIMLFPLIFVPWKIITRWNADRIMRQFVWLYGRGWVGIMAPFVRFRRNGFKTEKIKPPCILVVNHSSFFDTYCMALLPFSDVTFAIRAWPFKMFWYRPFMRLARYLNVESMEWTQISNTAATIISKGGALLFFPEGHRSRNGKLQRFYSGAFKLAIETGAKIVPLCLTGTDELLPPGRWWLKPARVNLQALAPVDPRAYRGPDAHRTMRRAVKNLMAQSLALQRHPNGTGHPGEPPAESRSDSIRPVNRPYPVS